MKKYEYKVKEPEHKKPERVARDYDFTKKSSANEKLLIAFVSGVVLDVVFYYLGLNVLYSVLRAVLGLSFVLFIPGHMAKSL